MPKNKQVCTGAEAIVECMKREQITNVFCVPGESYLPVLDALYDEPTIQLISARHEGGASFMAEGYAKACGKPGVVMATRGVGAANLAIGVHTAYQDSTPMVVLLGQVHRNFRGREGFQEVDLARFFSHIAKWTFEINEASRVPEIVQRAFRVAQSGRPGPVVLSLPEDMLPQTAKMEFGIPFHRSRSHPSEEQVKEIEACLLQSEKPLIIAGGGVKLADAEQALLTFASDNSIPVMAAFRRHDVFPNHHSLYVGHLGLGVNADILQTVKEADTIIAVGTRLSEITTQDYSIIHQDQTLLHIDIHEDTIGQVYPPEVGVVADAKAALESLSTIQLTPVWQHWIHRRRKVYEQTLDLHTFQEDNEVWNKQLITTLQTILPEDAIITNDAGNFAGWLHTFYQFKKRKTYVGPTSGAMGYGMPAALGAKLAHRNKTVVSLVGDGGFMMTMQELETAVRYQIPIIIIVFNNNMYGTIRMHQEIHYPHKPIGTELGAVPFALIASNMGAEGYKVQHQESFQRVLLKALQSKVPTLIEVETDPEQISVSETIDSIRKRSKQSS
ncbi:thiamine pyrophosphate-dependent enzyme [Pontibacillus litoralis]|uniref:Acetolactate synthase n=2 Tax=Pontibacillus TaxID=289201 RepID=A0A0A5G745_9BACI|nr:acetolactate synthase [Pontibacillus litoralis JSM 072002]